VKEKRDIKKRGSKLVTILISLIVILVIFIGYFIYTGIQVKKNVAFLETELSILDESNQDLIENNDNLETENQNLMSKLDTFQIKYDMLKEDVEKIYKSCMPGNACQGRFPGISWNCNNVGDETDDPSHICICDVSCKFKATPM
jgi:cell division protein FtsB